MHNTEPEYHYNSSRLFFTKTVTSNDPCQCMEGNPPDQAVVDFIYSVQMMVDWDKLIFQLPRYIEQWSDEIRFVC